MADWSNAEYNWPLRKKKLPEGHVFFTKDEMLELLDDPSIQGDAPIWIDNYWQPIRQIAQRPLDVIINGQDGVHFG